jgi:hypothetical protein
VAHVRAAPKQFGKGELVESGREVVGEALRLFELVEKIVGRDDPSSAKRS